MHRINNTVFLITLPLNDYFMKERSIKEQHIFKTSLRMLAILKAVTVMSSPHEKQIGRK
jgi:hypothetical protein